METLKQLFFLIWSYIELGWAYLMAVMSLIWLGVFWLMDKVLGPAGPSIRSGLYTVADYLSVAVKYAAMGVAGLFLVVFLIGLLIGSAKKHTKAGASPKVEPEQAPDKPKGFFAEMAAITAASKADDDASDDPNAPHNTTPRWEKDGQVTNYYPGAGAREV